MRGCLNGFMIACLVMGVYACARKPDSTKTPQAIQDSQPSPRPRAIDVWPLQTISFVPASGRRQARTDHDMPKM